MAIYLGAKVRSVTIEPEWDDGPERYADAQIEWPTGRFTEREIQQTAILISLAGPVAEMIYTGNPYHPGLVAEWAADWKQAWRDAGCLIDDERKRLAFLEQTTAELYQTLDRTDHWAAVAAIADSLLAHETLESEEVESIVRQWVR